MRPRVMHKHVYKFYEKLSDELRAQHSFFEPLTTEEIAEYLSIYPSTVCIVAECYLLDGGFE